MTCGCLGTWQLYRMRQKEQFIEQTREALQRDPISMPTDYLIKPFTKYQLNGKWAKEHLLVGPRACSVGDRKSVYGYTVIRRFISRDAEYLVNCGVLPRKESGTQFKDDKDDVHIAVILDQSEKVSLPPRWYLHSLT